jgi:bifunctional non-homologous end joining protein LigD
MAPTLVREPFHRAGWVFEEKVDGWRILAYKDGDRVRLVSRNGRDHTRRFRDLAAAVAKLSARTLMLDGEVAIYDQQLRSRFDWLREPDPGRRRHAAALHGVRRALPREPRPDRPPTP